MFNNPSTAQISIMAINFGSGFVAVLAIIIMQNIPTTASAANTMVLFFRVFPPYLIGEGFLNLSSAFFANLVYDGPTQSYFEWEVTGRVLCFLWVEAVGYFGIVLLLETAWFVNLVHKVERWQALYWMPDIIDHVQEDSDVLAEKERVAESVPDEHVLYVRGLRKTYPPSLLGGKAKHAVKGECSCYHYHHHYHHHRHCYDYYSLSSPGY